MMKTDAWFAKQPFRYIKIVFLNKELEINTRLP